jgi:hypothetical protein
MSPNRIAEIHNNKRAKKGYKYYSDDGKVYIGLETGRLQLYNPATTVQNITNTTVESTGVQSVTGLNTDNTDPANPVVQISVDGVTVTGAGTPASPLVATPSTGGVTSVTDDGNGVVTVDNTVPTTPVIQFQGVNVDGVTITGDGTTGNPLISATSGIKTALPFTTDHISATGNQYLIGDVVYYSGNVYRCIANNDSIIPTSTLYWTNLGAGYPLVQQPVDWSSTSGNNQVLNKPTIVSSVTDDGNGVVTVDNTIPTAPVIQFQGVNVDGLTITGDGTSGNPLQSPYNPPTDGYYGAFSDYTDQFAIAPNTAYVITLNTTDLTNGVTVVSNSRITFSATGIYNIQFSAQFVNTEVIEHDVTVWLRKNGVDVPGSAGFVAVVQKHGGLNGHSVPAWNYLVDALAGDYYELVWSTTDIDVYLATYAAAAPAPSIPSMIVTATQQSGIIAGTGITALNTLTASVQTMVTGTTGTDFNISSATSTHTFNLPTASATNRGALSSADWTAFNAKPSINIVMAHIAAY